MTTSESADDASRKGIASLTTLGRTKKKGSTLGQTSLANPQGIMEKGVNDQQSNFIAVTDASSSIDLKISLRPTTETPSGLVPESSTVNVQSPTTKSSNGVPDEQQLLQFRINACKQIACTEAFRSKHCPPPKAPGYSFAPSQPKDSFSPDKESITTNEILLPSHKSPTEEQLKPTSKPGSLAPADAHDMHKDFSLRSNLIMERIRFELILNDFSAATDVRTKALLVFAKFHNIDPSCKILPYHSDDDLQHQMFASHHNLPTSPDLMTKYVSSPMLHPRTQRLVFHTRFCTVISLLEMK